MIGRHCRFLAVALLAGASSAQAFQAADSDYSPKETRALTYAYAKCVVGREPRWASAALLADVDNATFLEKYHRLIIGACLVRETHAAAQMRFKGDLYRYALADALVRRELASEPVPNLANVPPISHREPGPAPLPVDEKGSKLSQQRYEEALKGHDAQVAFNFLARYGDCVVRAAPAQTKALLLTKPDSPEETVQFGGLGPALGNCMPEGHTLRFGRVALRGTLAINYYRLAHAARAAATGTAG
jgi:hypothetical protein